MVPDEERLRVLLLIINCFERTALEKLDSLATVYCTLGELTFQKAVSHFKEEPQLIYHCRPHLDRALYWACEPNKFRSDEVEELRHSIWLHQCMHESSNARRAGVRMLEAHLNNDEHLNMDIIWDIIDKFRQAILLAKEHDIEGKVIVPQILKPICYSIATLHSVQKLSIFSILGEAYACHYTAKVYQNVLKMTELAYTYHLRCVTLAQTLVPRNLTSLDWYMISSSFVQEHRAKKAREEEVNDEEKKNKYRIELASDLKMLDKKVKEGVQYFIEHIYTEHPPRKEGAKMGSIESDQLSKTVKKAIIHYHPDAQSSFNDEKWTFLCSEITKKLNVMHALFKAAV
jgi:hypothetical protein